MRKSLVLLVVMAALLFATTQAFALPGTSVDAKKPLLSGHVGWVTDYQPGVSITIQTKDGSMHTFDLTGAVKILPSWRAAELAVGSRVTIIARRDSSTHGWIAFGIVVHPAGSGGSAPPTVTPTDTPTATLTPTATSTETPTPTP